MNTLNTLLVFLLSIIVSCESIKKLNFYDADPVEQRNTHPYSVVQVIDGDTFWVERNQGERIKVRLIGIDAPETRNVFKKKKHPFGETSKRYLDSVLTNNPHLNLSFDVDSLDQYGRTLAYAFLADGTFINDLLIRNGYATIMTLAPNITYEQTFYQSQQYAREHKLGIWALQILQ